MQIIWLLVVFFLHKTLPQCSASELLLTPDWNVTIGFQKVDWATQILVKVSRLTVNSSAPKPHFPLHRFSESGVKGLVKGGGREAQRKGEEANIKCNCGFSCRTFWQEIYGPLATPRGRSRGGAAESSTANEKKGLKMYQTQMLKPKQNISRYDKWRHYY